MPITEKFLGQSKPADANAVSIYSPPAGFRVIVKTVNIVNTGASAINVRIFYDDAGTTYDGSTALIWDREILPGVPFIINVWWASDQVVANFAVRTDTADDATFTFFGVELN